MRFAQGGRGLERLAGPNATKRSSVKRRWRTVAAGKDPWAERTAEDEPWLRERRPALLREAAQQALLFPATRAFAQPTVIGAADLVHAPQPAILAPNHESDIDTPLVLASLPYAWRSRTVVGAASDRWYRKRGYAIAAGFWINTFPFDRGGGQRRGLAAAAAHLRDGRNVLLFPQGTRGAGPEGYRAGVAELAFTAGAPIIPIHIEGTALVMPKGRGLNRRHKTTVTFARPLHPRPGETPDQLTERLRQAIEHVKLVAMIERAPFGATGHESSRVIFGAAALAQAAKADADRTLELLLEHGINHIDVAASYGDAELRVAPWLKDHQFFLATKTGERTYAGAKEEIHRSLERLGVDHVDSIQLHNLVDAVEWDIALSDGGALEAAIEARSEGLVAFIGVTGHGLSIPKMHQRSLARFDFDSVLCPYNYVQMQDARYAETFDALAAICAERNVALQTIKSLARAPWEGREHTAATWYEPITEQDEIDLAVHWVLGNEQAFLLTTGDVEILPRLLDAAERYETRPTDEQMRALELAPLFT